jgi:hypothetical protein
LSAVIEVSFLPDVGVQKLTKLALYAASTAQLALQKSLDGDESLLATPTVVEQKVTVIHCVRAPLVKPVITSTLVRAARDGNTINLAERSKNEQTAELHGRIDLDAGSTSQIRLQASWHDIDDNPLHSKYALTSGANTTALRSINFERYTPPSGPEAAHRALAGTIQDPAAATMWTRFDLQCAENKVFLGPATPELLASMGARACVLNFGDARRKQAVVTATATGRYKDHFPSGSAPSFELTSDKVLVEVPASGYHRPILVM